QQSLRVLRVEIAMRSVAGGQGEGDMTDDAAGIVRVEPDMRVMGSVLMPMIMSVRMFMFMIAVPVAIGQQLQVRRLHQLHRPAVSERRQRLDQKALQT